MESHLHICKNSACRWRKFKYVLDYTAVGIDWMCWLAKSTDVDGSASFAFHGVVVAFLCDSGAGYKCYNLLTYLLPSASVIASVVEVSEVVHQSRNCAKETILNCSLKQSVHRGEEQWQWQNATLSDTAGFLEPVQHTLENCLAPSSPSQLTVTVYRSGPSSPPWFLFIQKLSESNLNKKTVKRLYIIK